MYIPIKVTTDYTLMNSMIKIDDLITFCKEKNIDVCGICDKNLFGVMKFYNSCKSNNIKPIIGLEISINNNILYIYAKNYEGYKNLLKINTIIQERELLLNDLKEYSDNIICIIPYNSNEIFDEIKNIFKDYYIGYKNEKELVNARIIDKNTIYIYDIKCLNKNDSKYLNYLYMIENNLSIKDIELKKYDEYTYNENISEIQISELNDFISKIDIEIPKDENYIPIYDKEKDSYEHLYNLTHKGLFKRLNNEFNKVYEDRLNYELSVIKKMGFVDYFLIVYDYVLYAKKNKILVGVGRGSAAGSLVSYTLGITDIDPIKYNLLFERFLNPERVTMPDIDIDFENTKRNEVIEYVKNRYGINNVAGIMTYGTLKSRLVVRSICKCLDINDRLVDIFINNIDSKLSLKENLDNKKVKELLNENEELKNVYKISLKLENIKRNISSHAAGVVISAKVLDEVIPVCINNNERYTGVTMEYLEDLGLLKMDFLAIKNLTTIASILDEIEIDTGKRLNLNTLNLDDGKVLKLFSDANTIGVFQFESAGMKNFLSKLKPTCFNDLISAIALFRPGPMENIDSFIRRKYGREKIDYIHPDLEIILKETYGIIVYQEQIMQILVKIGKYSFAEADNIRRAMSKKKKDIIDKEKDNFINKAINNGYDKNLAIKIYDLILKFANYGFNKSHSVAYALIGYQMAYLKVYYKEYFYANLLDNVIGIEAKTKEYIDEAKKFDFKILSPDINLSKDKYVLENNALRMPFGVIKNIGSASVSAILEEREKGLYKDYIDFIKRTYGNINSKIIESLINANCFKSFKYNNKTLIYSIDIINNYASLVKDLDEEFVEVPSIEIQDEYSEEELRTMEYNSYGFYITNHPSSKYKDKVVKIGNINKYLGKRVDFIVLVESIKNIKTKTNQDMAFIDASDETGKICFVLFNNVYDQINNIEINKLIHINGKVEKRLDKYQINIISTNKLN